MDAALADLHRAAAELASAEGGGGNALDMGADQITERARDAGRLLRGPNPRYGA